MLAKQWVFIIFLFFYVGFFILIYFLKNRTYKEKFKKLSLALNGRFDKFAFFTTFTGEFQGLKFLIRIFGSTKGRPPYLYIWLIKNSTFKLSLHKESLVSLAAQKLGIIREVKSGDETFDHEFIIFSDKPVCAKPYLSNEKLKTAIREIFNLGFNRLWIDGKKITIRKSNYNFELDLEPENVKFLLQRLSMLAQGL